MNDLARLIHRRKAELDLSWYEIAERGQFSSHTIVYTLAKKKVHRQPPRAETLTRLARALDVDLDIVRAAAASAAGYDVNSGKVTLRVAETARIINDVLEQISDEDMLQLRKIALSFLPDASPATPVDTTPRPGQSASRKAAETDKLRQELSDAADNVPGPANVRSISAKRSPRKKKT